MTAENRTHRIAHGLGWMFAGTAGQYFIQSATLLLMARILEPRDFGVVSAAMVVTGFLSIFSELGVGPALVQKASLTTADIGTANTMSVCFGMAFSAGLFLSSGFVANFFHVAQLQPVLKALCVVLPISGLSAVGQALLQREMQFKRWVGVNVSSYLIANAFIAVPMVFLNFGVWALVAGAIAQSFFMAIAVLLLVPDSRHLGFSRVAANALISFGGGFSIARVSNYFAGQGDNIVAGRILGPEALGLYGRAYQLMAMPAVLIGTVLDKVYFPAMAAVQNDAKRLGEMYITAVGAITMLAFPASAVMFVLADEIVWLLLGDKWLGAVPAFRILTSCLVFRVSYKMSDSLVRAKGAVYRRAWRQMAFAFSVFLLSWAGSRYGIGGIASGVALSVLVNFALMLHLSWLLIGFSWRAMVEVHVRYFIVSFFVGGAAFVAKYLGEQAGMGRPYVLALGCASALIALFGLLIFAKRIFGPEADRLGCIVANRFPRLAAATHWRK